MGRPCAEELVGLFAGIGVDRSVRFGSGRLGWVVLMVGFSTGLSLLFRWWMGCVEIGIQGIGVGFRRVLLSRSGAARVCFGFDLGWEWWLWRWCLGIGL